MSKFLRYLLLLLILIPSAAPAEDWWEEEQEERIPIVSRVIFGIRSRSLTTQEQQKRKLTPTTGGLLVTAVEQKTPAAAAGIQKGDVLLMINGETFSSPAELQVFLSKQGDGQMLHAVLLRNGEKVYCTSKLRARTHPIVVGYARPVERTVKSVKDSILSLQCSLAYHLAQCPHSQQAAQQCTAEIRNYMSVAPQSPLRLSYQDSHGYIRIDCYSTHFNIRAGELSRQLTSPQDELPPSLRERLLRLSQKN